MRALVTGAGGFIGSHLAERLIADGVEVTGVDCFTHFYPRSIKQRNLRGLLASPSFTFVPADLSIDDPAPLVDGVDVVYHLAAQAGVRPSFGSTFDSYVRHNVVGTQRLLEAVSERPLQAFVYASSSSVYGNPERTPSREDDPRRPRSPYGMTKIATEELAGVYHRCCGVPVVGLRYFTVYGPRQRPDMAFSRFVTAALSGQPLTILGDGHQVRDFTFVDDAVEATVAAARCGEPGAVYNVGGGCPIELGDALRVIAELLPGLTVRHEPTARGDVRATCADATLSRATFGQAPSTPLETGLSAQVDWMTGLTGPALTPV
jgi:nucleoside-diphosphate-sugar epimerase